jgi:predicted porin
LNSFFKNPPVQPDLTWNGITIHGAIDIAGQYESVGAPYAGGLVTSSVMISPQARAPQWLLIGNQTTQSYVGVKVDRSLTEDVAFIARLDSGFNPTRGELVNQIGTLQRANGVPLNQQYINGDGPRDGQIFNGDAWAGLDAKSWGAIHIGRNTSAYEDMLFAYDPLLSSSFSLGGWSPQMYGSPETARLDDSVKYLNTFGPFRTELMYAAPGTAVNRLYQATFGYVRPNFSIDILAGHTNDSFNVASLSGAANLGSTFLGAQVFDTDVYGIFGKYVFDIGGRGFRDPSDPRFTLSGGFSTINYHNPSDGGFAPGHQTVGGYVIGPTLSTDGTPGGGIVNYAFTGGDQVIDYTFIAGKYQHDEHWSVAAGYYHLHSNSFGFGVNSLPGIVSPFYSNRPCSSSSFLNCSGSEDVVSLRVDYDWTKNYKLYAGIVYSQVSGGMAFGFLHTAEITPSVGMRYSF